MEHTPREYDIVVLGANGYTATIVAEYITKNLPTNLRWALAGRSRKKLEALVARLKVINGDRRALGECSSTLDVSKKPN